LRTTPGIGDISTLIMLASLCFIFSIERSRGGDWTEAAYNLLVQVHPKDLIRLPLHVEIIDNQGVRDLLIPLAAKNPLAALHILRLMPDQSIAENSKTWKAFHKASLRLLSYSHDSNLLLEAGKLHNRYVSHLCRLYGSEGPLTQSAKKAGLRHLRKNQGYRYQVLFLQSTIPLYYPCPSVASQMM
jgi:hypothetical protein